MKQFTFTDPKPNKDEPSIWANRPRKAFSNFPSRQGRRKVGPQVIPYGSDGFYDHGVMKTAITTGIRSSSI